MPCQANELGAIAPFTRVSVAQAFLPVPQDATCEEPRRRGSAGVVCLEFDVWNVRFEFASIPKGKERNRAHASSIFDSAALLRWHRPFGSQGKQECLCYLEAITALENQSRPLRA